MEVCLIILRGDSISYINLDRIRFAQFFKMFPAPMNEDRATGKLHSFTCSYSTARRERLLSNLQDVGFVQYLSPLGRFLLLGVT